MSLISRGAIKQQEQSMFEIYDDNCRPQLSERVDAFANIVNVKNKDALYSILRGKILH